MPTPSRTVLGVGRPNFRSPPRPGPVDAATLAFFSTLWDASAKNAHAVISGGGLTAAGDNSSGSFFSGRADSNGLITAGQKRYWELTINNSGALASNDIGGGVCNASQSFADGVFVGSSTNGISFYCGGDIYYNGSPAGGAGAYEAPIIICIAVIGGSGFWARRTNNSWNSNGSADPATNTGGLSISGMGDIYPSYTPRNLGSLTANFGATPFTYAVPSGFNV